MKRYDPNKIPPQDDAQLSILCHSVLDLFVFDPILVLSDSDISPCVVVERNINNGEVLVMHSYGFNNYREN